MFAIHNVIRYLYLQSRYKGNGISLVIFYCLAILVFSTRIAQYSIEVDSRHQGQNSKLAYILGTIIVILEIDIGVAMILLVK